MKGAISLNLFLYIIVLAFVNFSTDCAELNQNEPPIIDAGELGRIRGVRMMTLGSESRVYYSFSGMRYAQAPTGSQRFMPSIRAVGNLSGSDEPYGAISAGLSCSQPDVVIPLPSSEDCLTLNVHTPRLPREGDNDSDLLPVIFFIHGGAFTAGTGMIYTGARLLNKDVVLVSINYRLGAFGFFSLGIPEVPGNAGLYDMINALDWTRDYIKYFGGDPNRITISGQSSGSVAVTHMLASPLAKGKFQGAIACSGSALATWGTARNPMESSLKLAEMANCYTPGVGDPDDAALRTIGRCMKGVDRQTLVNKLYDYQINERLDGRLGFDAVAIVVQKFAATPEVPISMPKHPLEIFQSGEQSNVPLMQGTTRHDGSYVLGVFWQRYLKPNKYLEDPSFMSNMLVPKLLEALDIQDDFGIQNSIASMYLGDSRKTGDFFEMYPGIIDLCSVFFFKAPAYQTALLHSRFNNHTYWYSFDYKGRNTMFAILFGMDLPPFKGGIGHGDDLIYVFQTSLADHNTADSVISKRMIDYWVNFAYHGTPTPESFQGTSWPTLNETTMEYLSIDSDSVVQDYYERHWHDVGWEILTPTTTTVATTPRIPPTSTDGNDSVTMSAFYNFKLQIVTLFILYVSTML